MTDYSHTKSRVLQWIGIIAILCLFGAAYWYFQVYAGVKTNVSPTGSLTSGLVGYWTFDGADTTSTTATDRGSGGNNGTLTNGPTVTPGKVGQALNFDGVDDYVDTVSDIAFTGAFTFSTWFYTSDNSQTGIIFGEDSGTSSTSPKIGISSGNFVVRLVTTTDSAISVPTSGSWHHMVITRDSSNKVDLYVDGGSASRLFSDVAQSGTYTLDTLGANGSTISQYFNGRLDEVRAYNAALSAAEIQSLYKQGQSDEVNTGASQSQSTGQLDSGLNGYWALDNGSGTSATDSSINGNTGTLTNGPTWSTGQIGSAVTFDGTDDYINISDPSAATVLDFGTTNFSVSIWFKTSSTTARRMINKISSTPVGWLFDVNATTGGTDSAGDLRFRVRDSGGGGADYAVALSLNDDSWHMATAVVDRGGTRTLKIFADGVEVGSTSLSSLTASISNAEAVGIGVVPSTLGNYYSGQLDEARTYSRVLSADEVANLYRLTSPTVIDTSLKGYWSFNGQDTRTVASVTTTYDHSGAGNYGQYNNSPAVGPGKVGQAVVLDGSNDYVVFAGSGLNKISPLISGASAVTISAWMKPSAYPSAGNAKRAFEAEIQDGSGGVILDLYDSAGNIRVGGRSGTGDSFQSTTFAYPALNEWHLTTGVLDFANDTIYIYLDGVLVKTTTVTFANSTYTPGTPTANLDSIGSNVGVGSFFSGALDEVRIYSTALSAAQIQSLYKQGQSDEVNTGTSQPQGGGRLDSGLAGYWALDDGSGTSATDSSTNGNTGTLTSGPTWTTGQTGSAVLFDGSNDYISYGTNIPFDSNDFSVSAWVRRDGAGGGADGTSVIFTQRITTTGSSQPAVNLYLDSSHRPTATIRDNVGAATTVNSTTATTVGQWTHLAMVKTRNTLTLYTNGVSIASSSHSLSGDFDAGAAVRAIGKNNYDSVDYGFFNGAIDEVRVYTRALLPDEVGQLYNLNAPTGVDTGLKGYWSFNGKDVSGTTAYDRSGAGNTGTTSGSPGVAPGKIGQGIAFDGSDDSVSVADVSSIDYDYNQDFSVSVWVKLPSTQADTTSTVNSIIEKWNAVGVYPYVLRVYNQTHGVSGDRGKVVFLRYDGTNNPSVTSTSLFNDNAWHQVVATKSGSTLTLYVDGASQATTTDSTTTTTTNNSSLYIGTRGDLSRYLQGSLDEIRLYNRALSTAEVAALYSNR